MGVVRVEEFSYSKDSSSFVSLNLNRAKGKSSEGMEKRLQGVINR